MRTGGGDDQAVRPRDPLGGCTKLAERGHRLLDICADARRQLDDRRVQLRLQCARKVELRPAAYEDVDGAGGLERLGVEDHDFLLDTDRQRLRFAEAPFDHVLPRMPCTGRPAAYHA